MDGGEAGPPPGVGSNAPRRCFQQPLASARHGWCMTFLSRLSVRAILNAVTLTLAASLCLSLLVPIGAACRAVTDADRLTALAVADRGVFQTLTAMRLNRAAVQTAIQADDDPSSKL